MSESRRPEGLTDYEWFAILQYRALQSSMQTQERYRVEQERAAYEQRSKAFDADREAFARFARTLGFVYQADARFHADFSSFRSDVERP